MKKFVDKVIAKIAFASAVSGAGAASTWNTYQPKEPEILTEKAIKG